MRAARPSPLVLLLVLLLGRAAAAPPAVVARVTIGCGVASTLAWSRRLCFEKYAAVSYPTPRSLSVTLSLEVTLLPAPGAAASANATPAPGPCGDTIRLQFWGATGLAAPPASLAVPHPSGACGLYTATLLLPSLDATAAGAHAATYAPEARVVHCAGEGLLDPPTPRPHPARLADFSDGPAVWNARAMFAPGAALHIVLRRGGGGAAGLLAAPPPPPALPPPLSWGVAKLGSAAAVPRAMPGVKGSAAGPARLRPGLPPCLGGDAPGVWVPHTSLYPDHPGDPVQWRPHDCVYRRFSGPRLDGCLNRTRGPVLVLGESTLRQAELLMRLHIADGSAHWPRAMRHETFPPAHPNMEAIEAHGAAVLLSEGLPWLAARGGGGGGPAGGPGGRRRRRPHAIVVLQGANDAARDAAGATHARLLQFLDALAAMVANGTVLAPTVPLVWVTAPVRHYVSGPGPGQVGGGPTTCVHLFF